MHDLDRTFMETEGEFSDEYGFELEGEGEGEGETLSEGELNELAAELLSVSNEAELEQFLGGILKKVASAAGSFIKSPIGKSLVGALKGAAGKLLPVAGAALGNLVAPGVGGAIGGKLGSMAGSALGLELEGLSSEDREFEVAKQFVRLAADAAKNTVGVTPPSPQAATQQAQQALKQAAAKFAPGLLNGRLTAGRQQSGRWIRRGNKIVLFGV